MAAKGERRGRSGRKGRSAARTGRLLNRLLIFATAAVIAIYLIPISAKITDDRAEVAFSEPGDPITVQVLNGCGVPGLAHKVTRFLRSGGCDVVEMTNADHFHYAVTKIVARTGDVSAAERVREILGFGEVVSAPDSTLMLEVSVILGSDGVPFPPAWVGRDE